MEIYKLEYKDKKTAIADLTAKGVYIEAQEGLIYGQGIQAIVEIGLILKSEGTYDVQGNLITEPIYYDAYYYDIMSEQKIVFESEIFPLNSVHSFAGYITPADENKVIDVV